VKRLSGAILVMAILLAAFVPTANAGILGSVTSLVHGVVQINPNLAVHPYLQAEAHSQPSKRVRVIVQKTGSNVLSQTLAQLFGGTVVDDYPYINSFVTDLKLSDILQLALSPGVAYISPDAPVVRLDEPAIDTTALQTAYPAAVGADRAWNDPSVGATGAGVTVAVVDTGVNGALSDFGGRVVSVNASTAATVADGQGHGTHVAGIIGGDDVAGGNDYVGIAPQAGIVSVKIADDQGNASESDLLRGLAWIDANHARYGIRAVNLSVSTAMPESYITSAVDAAVERLWFDGVVVVTAAGNLGPAAKAEWYAPANDPFVVTVGCLDDNGTPSTADDSLCSFSSRGATAEGYAKPDVVAPGRRIVSTLAGANVALAQEFPDRISDGGRYIRLSGTSMSAPVVTGSVALLLQRNPSLTPDQVKWLLTQTATAYPGQTDAAGAVNVYGALTRAAAGGIGSANQGVVRNPASVGGAGSLLGNVLSLPVNLLQSVNLESSYWDSSYWDSSYWDSSYWDSSYWDANGAD
jgi:serine protease AprX